MTTDLWVDLVLLLLLVGGAVAGWRRGGLRLAGSVAGLVVGLGLGLALVPRLTASSTGTTGWLVTIVGVLVVASLGAGIGRWLGGLLASVVARLHLTLLDRAAGAVGGLVLAFVLVGSAISLLTVGPGPTGDWLATARGSQLGSAASAAADRALELVREQGSGLSDVRLPGGVR